MQERTFLIIDGSNFYHRLKELPLKGLLQFDYERFAQFLVGPHQAAAYRNRAPAVFDGIKS